MSEEAVDQLRLNLQQTTLSPSPSSSDHPSHKLSPSPSSASPSDEPGPHISAIAVSSKHHTSPALQNFHPPYPALPFLPAADHSYIAQPFYDNPYLHTYPPYLLQSTAGDYAYVPPPFSGSVSPESQFPYASTQMVQFPPAAAQYWPYNSGILMLDPQDMALLPAGTMMLDPTPPGAVAVNDAADYMLGYNMPFQQGLEGNSNLNMAAAAGFYTPAIGFPMSAVPPCDDQALPVTAVYPVYHNGNIVTGTETWDAPEDYLGSYPGYFYLPTDPVQSYGAPAMVHFTPESGTFNKGRVPLLDVTTNLNSLQDGSAPQIVENISATGKDSQHIGRDGGRNNFVCNTEEVSQTPCKSVEQASELPGKEESGPPDEQQDYNRPDFKTDYKDAKFFIIKSFSEANVRQSVKYKVWSSTHHGNRKLDQAFEDAHSRAKQGVDGCPVFLFFSVNGSGQFCGIAEMTGRVDYTKTMDCWDRERWSGSFPVKWHIVKNVPNFQLHGIILQDNENKPVTNSRDTQEVNLEQGLQMLNIFKNYYARPWILDNHSIHQNSLESP